MSHTRSVSSMIFAAVLAGCSTHATAAGRDGGQPTIALTPPKFVQADAVPHVALMDEIDHSDVLQMAKLGMEASVTGASRVVILINSNGGEIEEAHKIYMMLDLMRDQGIKTICVVDGRAWSAAFALLQSCSVRLMTKRSTLMAHEPSIQERVARSGHGAANMQAALDAMSVALAEQCSYRLNISRHDYEQRVKDGQEMWLDWEAALKMGAVDGTVDNVPSVWH